MHKNRLSFFILLFGFWLVLTQAFNAQHLLTGLIISVFLAWFWGESVQLLPENLPHPKLYLKFLVYLFALLGEIISSNIQVAKILLAGKTKINPKFVVFQPNLATRWGRILLANSITITPGTVTIDVNPDTDQFVVHAISQDLADSVHNSKLIKMIQELETYRGNK
ncbi:MAG: Na+/H+ antiporter subunit E [Firmicutes bacterium]|nr:Na+/H+ antiporter subunit E [Bacillota bacterium]